jgi:type I restriction enzyme M protein
MDDLKLLEDRLWHAADQLRANSKLNASQYMFPVLGILFLRYATRRLDLVRDQVRAGMPNARPDRVIGKNDVKQAKKRALWIGESDRFDTLAALPESEDIGARLDKAMIALEAEAPETLRDVLPRDYARFPPDVLRGLLRTFNDDALSHVGDDAFGRIYEYFLQKFALTGAQEGGEFFTPPSLVRLIVGMLEPRAGLVFDPACGSGGMFVHTGHFMEAEGIDPATVTFAGREKSELNAKLARMNLAVHGLSHKPVMEDNSFYPNEDPDVGRCDFVMANPPFNVDGVPLAKVKDDRRLLLGVPSAASDGRTVSNGNYLWTQYFYAYLSPAGRAGFVMASSATDAGGERERQIRAGLLATGDVDAIVAVGPNFFYTRTLPSTLWFFDRSKPEPRRDRVLMIDARAIFRVVNRRVRDWSDDQLTGLLAISWLHRGEEARYAACLSGWIDRALVEARDARAGLGTLGDRVRDAEGWAAEATDVPDDRIDREQALALARARGDVAKAREALSATVDALDAAMAAAAATPARDRHLPSVSGEGLGRLATAVREAVRAGADAAKAVGVALEARRRIVADAGLPGGRGATRVRDVVEAAREAASHAGKVALASLHELRLTQERFPEGRYRDVPGLCASVTRARIAAEDGSFTPGRYVGTAPAAIEDEDDAMERLAAIHAEIAALDAEAAGLAERIAAAWEGIAG